jgi:aconitate hydratase
MPYPQFEEPDEITINEEMLAPPAPAEETVELEKGPNIKPLPDLTPLPQRLDGPVLIKVGDDISTDEIMPAGSDILPFRSNIPEISKFVFYQVDEDYYDRAMEHQEEGHFVVAGENYGQGSSREHAALAPRYLGLQAVVAKSFARIHWQNLVNFGILPLTFVDGADHGRISAGDRLVLTDVRQALQEGGTLQVHNETEDETYEVEHTLSPRQVEMMLAGGQINLFRRRQENGRHA